MKLIDPSHPFYAPLWRRVAIVAVVFLWSGLEFYNDAQTWGIIVAAIGVYCVWQFFVAFEASGDGDGDGG